MKAVEKQHNAPPMPESRRKPTEAIAKHFHAIGIPCKGCSSTDHGLMALKKKVRQDRAKNEDNLPGSRQEAKARAAEALARHREEKGVTAPPAKKYEHPHHPARKSALDLLRAKLPKAHSAQRIDFAQRMYADRAASLRQNLRAPLSSLRGHVSSYDPRSIGAGRCELYFPQRGAVPVGI